jgi:EAL domain-containing protein (putative c-di-GMP-specific phosphodiesterase class I)
VSVNLSCTHLRTANFVRQVLEILAGNGLSGGELHLEITESIFGSDDKELFCRVLNELAVTGVQLLLDDFGTGYSSLSRLHELPIHILKIDRSFMAHLVGTNAKVVEAIITLAHNMDKQVIAEGIETREQMRQLAELGCEYGQGYYFSRPLPEQEASKLIAGQLSWEKDFAVPMSLELSQFMAKGLGLDRLRSQ